MKKTTTRKKQQSRPKKQTAKQQLSKKSKKVKRNKKKISQKTVRKKRTISKKKKKRLLYKKWLLGIRDYLIVLVISILVIGFISTLFFSVNKVDGYSMMPALRNKDFVVVRKKNTFKRFDLLVFQKGKGKAQIRRVIGFPGEVIEMKEDILYVDGQIYEEKYLVDEINESQQSGADYTENFSIYKLTGKAKIPSGKYLVLGDNRPYGTDSRDYGLIDKEEIIGVVKLKLLPINNMEKY